ncbi:constitutive coactivator of PPAR-gamma-like protein 2 isoform X1 [Canis lupus baileyi]|uniref:Family with sequence similarity 120 member C n=3 Tax=Canis lupus TaxID=9612 RepID=A0A8C0TGC9_CANLF|nr:constitutive coactivator of PPAR-gamma-like protein 2 isoform X1 [Canis lupus dingo]XP_038306033.1 constitutive coactivator of PPAR-gamma-like protein 2 isoform X1 [Canis lupus familiaris]XP_038320241.1 constitutive coactivator of PPAR-gamma-like protein 2 isoform X1 [Canis lupus familiaris]XP_038443444.1 constitutive coactivator of PPAR-gamma-like protein 2 isoform X1 [Canis lupus familiaris]
MGVQGFQEFLEKRCPGAVVPVDLLKLARTVSRQQQQHQHRQLPPTAALAPGAPRAARGSAPLQPPLPPAALGAYSGGAGPTRHHHPAHHFHHQGQAHPGLHPPPPPLPPPLPGARVLVDAGSALPRLYGGYQTDWVCGGQWNAMLGYLSALCQACAYPGGDGLELVVMFPGGLGKDRLAEWGRRCQAERQTAQLIVGHVGNKGTPPPRAWFLPPACLSHCVRLALIRFRVKVFQSLEDHHLEVVAFFRENGFHGLLAHDSEYALYNIPSYYSSHALKLSWNGKNLTTNQFLMQEVAKQLGLKRMNFPIFAALLGNHILPDEDLAAFHWSLLGPEHPLASLKVRAHQLVLPPCDVVIKAVSEYVSSIKDPSNLDVVGKDVFKQSQSRIEDKIERFKKAVEYYSVTTKLSSLPVGPSSFLGFRNNRLGNPPLPRSQMGTISTGKPMFSHHVPQKMKYPPPFPMGPNSSLLFSSHALGESRAFSEDPMLQDSPFANWAVSYDSSASQFPNYLTSKASPPLGPDSSHSSSSDGDEPNGASSDHITETLQQQPGWEDPNGERGSWVQPIDAGVSDASLGDGEPHIPSLLSMSTRNHMDITIPPLPPVAPEVLRVAEHRHRRGLMYPYIYHVLTKGEIKIPVCIEDECNMELPPAALLFRSARQYVYGVLFSLAETQRKMERLAIRRRLPVEVPSVILKEWSAYKGKSPQTPELVSALTFREWTCPNLKKLWLGKAVEDKNRRMRAFLACMKSDTPSMLNPANVPTHLLLMCCVLRYMVQWPGGRILHRHELDTFLAQAVSTQLYEPDQLQELKIEKLDARGIQLAALFMSGVDTALFANDACGQPVPWEHCCPWIYFDGKLFQSKLIKAGRERVSLVELCDGQADLATKVEKMRQSILEGVNMNHPPPSALLQSPTFVPPMVPSLYPVSLYSRAMGSVPPPPQGRSRGFPGLHPIPPQGGKLEIAGMVVGQWAGSRSSRGRGSFGMQVVSVGGPGKGHGKEQTGRGSKGHKKGNKQGTSDGVSKSLEPHQGRSHSQVNGNNGTFIKEEKSGHHLTTPSQCALSRDSNLCNNGNRYFPVKNGEKSRLREQKLGTVAQQKEE